MPTLTLHPDRAPRGTFRGGRRYFRNIAARAERVTIEPLADSWWDHWHYHADWHGWGNLSWRLRLGHLRVLCMVLRKIHAARERFAIPFQTWILIDGEDAAGDATYLHTPNPNGTPFPWTSGELTPESLPIGEALRRMLPELPLRFSSLSWRDSEDQPPRSRCAHIVWSPSLGATPA